MPVTPQSADAATFPSGDVISGVVVYPQGLEVRWVNVDQLKAHPLNANSTDTDPIVESITMNGFIQPILVQKSTSYIIDGWHRYAAALQLNAEIVPVILYDCDDVTARRLLVACNRTARLGRDDPGLLRNLMESIRADDTRLLGTGWSPMQWESYLELMDAPYEPDVEDFEEPVRQHHIGVTCPACGHEFGGGR